MRSVVTLLAVVAAVLALLPEARVPPPNVILVSIDTLRADHLGCYGYERATSPRIDDFSREAVLFAEAVSEAPSTLASHASILTSLIVPHHQASFKRRVALPAHRVTLTEVLRRHGYATRSWNGGGQLDAAWGLDQGFDEYRSVSAPSSRDEDPEREATVPSTDRFHDTVEAALGWLDVRTDRGPFFLFLHTYEVHHPYTPDPELRALFGRFPTRLGERVSIADLRRFNRGELPLGDGDLRHIVASYDAEIRSVDRAFGELVDGLRARDLDTRTLVVLTSDHGEEFAEHGVVGWHSHTLFDELLRVPLIVRLPGAARGGVRVLAPVRGIDVAPTILDVVGLRSPAVFEGRSLLPALDAPDSRSAPPALAARDGGRPMALRASGFKWIRHGGFYDLRADPREQNDLGGRRGALRARARAMRQALRAWLSARPDDPRSSPSAPIDADLAERLRALGYVDRP